MNRLNVFRVVVPPCPSHAAGMDMVRYDVAIGGEPFFAESTEPILRCDLPVEKLPHFSIGAEVPVSPWMMRIFNAPNAHLARPFLSRDCFSAAAEERTVNRAQLITAESHGLPPALDLKTRLTGT
jgi:hypothetical protein